MKRAVLVLLFLFCGYAIAQDYTPKAEIGLGYSYSYARVPNSTTRVNMNGLLINTTFNANSWLGAEVEFGTHYHCISDCWINGWRVEHPDETNDSVSFLVGPRVNLARSRRVSPWIHVLGGVTRTAYSNHLIDQKISTTGWGWAAGGGLDLPYHRATLRVIQVDFTRYAAQPEGFNNVRIGAGILIRVGSKKDR